MATGSEPQEVEVERLGEPNDAPGPPGRPGGSAGGPPAGAGRPLSPVVFGMLVDALDLATRGPRWAVPGFFLGQG